MSRYSKENSVSLIELVIGMAMLGIIILAISQLDLFSNSSVINSQRRITMTNEASLALEHITLNLNQAIGTLALPAAVSNVNIGGNRALRFWVDSNANFMRDDPADRQRAYRWTGAGGMAGNNYLLRYCDRCQAGGGLPPCDLCVGTNSCNGGGPACWGVVVARNVAYFGRPLNLGAGDVLLQGNSATIEVQACSNPVAANCDTPNNPQVDMQATIQMPKYSVN